MRDSETVSSPRQSHYTDYQNSWAQTTYQEILPVIHQNSLNSLGINILIIARLYNVFNK